MGKNISPSFCPPYLANPVIFWHLLQRLKPMYVKRSCRMNVGVWFPSTSSGSDFFLVSTELGKLRVRPPQQ